VEPCIVPPSFRAQQRLYFLPEPHGQGSFRLGLPFDERDFRFVIVERPYLL